MKPRMHPADIVAAVRKRGTNLAALARLNGFSNSALNYALLYPSKRAEAVLADFLGVPPRQLWPDRYDRNGDRLVGRRAHRTTNIARRYRKGQSA